VSNQDNSEEFLADPASLGTAMASLLISINTLQALHKNGVLSQSEQLHVLNLSLAALKNNAKENPEAYSVAETQITTAKQMLLAMTAGSSGEAEN
jgi:hypothetical protein